MNKKILISTICLSLLLMTGCLNKEESNNIDKEAQTRQVKEDNIQKGDEIEMKEVTEINSLSEQLQSKEEVENGKVYKDGESIVAKIIIKKDVKEQDIKNLVNQYSKELQNSYKKEEIQVQAIRDGKIVEETTINEKPQETSKTTKNVLKNLNSTIINTIPGVFAIKVPLDDLKKTINASEKSVVVLEISNKEDIELTYHTQQKVFYNANIQGYTEEELKNAIISKK